MSLEIGPQAALYPPPPIKKNVLYRAAILSFALSGRRFFYLFVIAKPCKFYNFIQQEWKHIYSLKFASNTI